VATTGTFEGSRLRIRPGMRMLGADAQMPVDESMCDTYIDETMYACIACGNYEQRAPEGEPVLVDVQLCRKCFSLFPPSLVQAVTRPGNYILRTCAGEVVQFAGARLHGAYATLSGLTGHVPLGHRFEHGLDVRVDTIAWCGVVSP
jgi:hypothetical protein